MNFPNELDLAIKQELKDFETAKLVAAAQEMSADYRSKSLQTLQFSRLHNAAYAATRMPATLAVVQQVLRELEMRLGASFIKTILDLGAGPGTASWAAALAFADVEVMAMIEKDDGFIELGKRLAAFSPNACLRQARWHKADLSTHVALGEHDLIMASYSLGELSPDARQQILRRISLAAGQIIVVIEPGTPRGYGVILEARQFLINEGFFIAAPCPHIAACPMKAPDWCHFSKRLERPSFHRQIKLGELGFEDEKYSYLIATKRPFPPCTARIVHRPIKRSGHICLDLCTKEGHLKRQIVSKRDKEAFRCAKKSEWGDGWD